MIYESYPHVRITVWYSMHANCILSPPSLFPLHTLDSRLLPFAQLAVCHAMLAKLPSAILIGEIVEQKPLLLLLFPIVCKLFERYIHKHVTMAIENGTSNCVGALACIL